MYHEGYKVQGILPNTFCSKVTNRKVLLIYMLNYYKMWLVPGEPPTNQTYIFSARTLASPIKVKYQKNIRISILNSVLAS